MAMIAALFVAKNGPYFGLDGVDPWDESRDAREYNGPHPVVAHPPCGRWGTYWYGGPSAKVRRERGDDNGCFAQALWAVRTFGGVLEHPAGSSAWKYFGIFSPPFEGGWVNADFIHGGFTCHVEQGHYGHRARKATWLYAVSKDLPSLKWGPSRGIPIEESFRSTSERARARAAGIAPIKRISAIERIHTPSPFRDILIGIAKNAL